MTQIPIGMISHYSTKSHEATVRLDKGVLKRGDQIHIVGKKDDLWEEVTNMWQNNDAIEVADVGEEITLRCDGPVHRGAEVFKVTALEAYIPHAAMEPTE